MEKFDDTTHPSLPLSKRLKEVYSVYLSHTLRFTALLLHDSPALDFLKQWDATGKTKSNSGYLGSLNSHSNGQYRSPTSIQDFWGFPRELYQMNYSAPGHRN